MIGHFATKPVKHETSFMTSFISFRIRNLVFDVIEFDGVIVGFHMTLLKFRINYPSYRDFTFTMH